MKVLGIQSGIVETGMTNEEYFMKQVDLARERFAGQDMVMFPELMTGEYFGFVKEKRWFDGAEDFLKGSTTATMLKLSKELNTHVCYSLFEKAEDGYYNTMGLISPTRGVIGKYRKIHIPGGDARYSILSEKYYFRSGSEMPVYQLDNGVKVAMMLCYDRSFPEQWRTYYLKGAQFICVATCTMGLRADMFVTELQTRALESHTYVMALNRAGVSQIDTEKEPRVHFGKSLVCDPLGNIEAILDDEPWTTIEADMDIEKLAFARGRLNWERDRHPELYGIIADTNYAMEGMIYENGFEDLE